MRGNESLKSVNKAAAGAGALLLLLVLNLGLGNPLFHLFFGAAVSAGTRPTPPPAQGPGKDKTGKDKTGRASPQGASQSTAAPGAQDEFARYDPSLKLEELNDLASRPVPKLDRNPFEWEPTQSKTNPEQAPTPPPPPPPPPPIMLKVVGYSEKPGGTKEAYICESRADGSCNDDKEVYVVHEGEEFGNHYKAVKIVPTEIDVVDEATQQSAQLVVPQ